ncbi:hypothetical protein PILCRDRAFT_78699 [Piloderma croceum F 1598]|uniref:Protein kinase domain-containing protein n=1 Tax=Piloderma croceum (strain F 1598) TaxID=765440 RepID=A0A0C3F6I7_PILCF|nr:hypothetical protein PILCRDRAFT_78699 [Piloderma croceum F 1598]
MPFPQNGIPKWIDKATLLSRQILSCFVSSTPFGRNRSALSFTPHAQGPELRLRGADSLIHSASTDSDSGDLAQVISASSRKGCHPLIIVQPSSTSQDHSVNIDVRGAHYICISEHADLWEGRMSNKVSVKKVAFKGLHADFSSNPDFLANFNKRLEYEARIWHHLKHPNVSEFYGIAFNLGYMPALILPFYSNGTVIEYVREKGNESRLDMVKQIAQGLEYLHGQSVVHGDLRGSNVLVDDNERPRICDYGLAFIIEPSEFTSMKTTRACRWTAPEIMNPPENTTYAVDSFVLFTKESDIYAFAMTVLEIFTGDIPFHHKNDSSVIFAVLDGIHPELPPFLKEQESLGQVVQECWHQEPSRRPTSREVNERLNTGTPEVFAIMLTSGNRGGPGMTGRSL